MFTNAESVFINGKEVKSIIASDGGVLYQKKQELSDPIIIRFRGSSLSEFPNSLVGNNIIIDYGDGTVVNYDGVFGHIYREDGTYEIKIYNVTNIGNNCFMGYSHFTRVIIPNTITSLGRSCFQGCTDLISIVIPDSMTTIQDNCFTNCTSLTSINLPSSITSIGAACFLYCSGLTSIILNWTTSNEIIKYNSKWVLYTNENLKFIIPNGITPLYVDKGYPIDQLIEYGDL